MRCEFMKETGTALVVTVGLLFLVTLLGFSTVQWAIDETGIAANQKASVQARYIAESGVALMLQWFQGPATFPEVGTFPNGYNADDRSRFLRKRQIDSRGAPSFFNDKGESQFSGTAEAPDFWYQAASDSRGIGGGALSGQGAITSLKLYRPVTPGAVGTIEAMGTTVSGIGRTVSVEIIPSPIPPATSAVQVGPGSDVPLPVLVHWGDVQVIGDADLDGSLDAIPKKEPLAPVNGQPYPAFDLRDAWLDFWVGGSILNPPVTACPDCAEPFLSVGYGHLHQLQAKSNTGFSLDPWDYQSLKAFAKSWGVYYTTDREGFIYRDGVNDSAHRSSPSQALASHNVGDNRGFVFIDTVDQNPPNGTNLAALDLPIDYLEGLFSIQAHVVLRESGPGRSIPVQSPPSEGTDDSSTRRSLMLSTIHLKGVLSMSGRLTIEGRPMVFGTLIAQQGFSGSGRPEVWYDADLRAGYYPGLPMATVLKGSWYNR